VDKTNTDTFVNDKTNRKYGVERIGDTTVKVKNAFIMKMNANNTNIIGCNGWFLVGEDASVFGL
jgi:hypothetical protein